MTAEENSSWAVSEKCGICGRYLFVVCFPVGNGGSGSEPNYRVVATDYSSYAIVYNCNQKLLVKKGESFDKLQLQCGCLSSLKTNYFQNLCGCWHGNKILILSPWLELRSKNYLFYDRSQWWNWWTHNGKAQRRVFSRSRFLFGNNLNNKNNIIHLSCDGMWPKSNLDFF